MQVRVSSCLNLSFDKNITLVWIFDMSRIVTENMRRICEVLAVFFFVGVLCEGMSFLTYGLLERQFFSYSFFQEKRGVIAGIRDNNMTSQPSELRSSVQPYFGYAYDPKQWKKVKHNGLPVNDWGFIDDKPSPILARSDNKFIVGFLGGSVALWASTPRYSQILVKSIQAIPRFANKEIVFVRLALGGMKEPQQLMTLNYLLALGAHFDMLINLDGVNEVVEPHFNRATGVNPFYPVNWKGMIGENADADSLLRVAELKQLEMKRAALAGFIEGGPWRYSITGNVLWLLCDRLLDRKLSGERSSAGAISGGAGKVGLDESYAVKGHPVDYRQDDDFEEQLARVWYESSLSIGQLAAAKGIEYFHFLQPNQYVEGSKKAFSTEEIAKGVLSDASSERYIRAGYPLLREKGRVLQLQGVNFVDLSMVFVERDDSVYQDSCCHLNVSGNEILVEAMGEALSKKLN